MPDGLVPLAYPLLPEVVARPPREAVPIDRRRAATVLLLLVLLHLAGALLLDAAMRLRPALARLLDARGIEVRWIDPQQPASASAPAPLIASSSGERPVAPAATDSIVAARTAGMRAEASPPLQAPAATIALDSTSLFDPDGSPRLSTAVIDAAASTAAGPDFAPPAAQALAPLRSPLPYKPTRFEPYWVPANETLGEELVRQLALEKEFKTPWGTRWRCTTVLFVSACSDVPPAPMKNRPAMPWETYEPLPAGPAEDPF